MDLTYRSMHIIYRVGIKLKPERTQIPREITNGWIISERNVQKRKTIFELPPLIALKSENGDKSTRRSFNWHHSHN